MTTLIETLDAVDKLTKDLKTASVTLSKDEARFLVDAYYTMQEQRIRTANQVRALSESGEPHSVIQWYLGQSETLENQVKRALDAYSGASPLGCWARSICGIGPVISAGLLAHIDVTKPTVGHIWRFAGLDPTVKWEKGQKRPWNASLKTLCWKMGESFVKVQNNDADVYGKMYAARKQLEAAKNAEHAYKDQAAAMLAAKRIGKETGAYKAYSEGELPDGHLHARAKRYAVKMFLSHYHAVGHFLATGRVAPRPWIIEFGGHAHMKYPPNLEMVPGLREAYGAIEVD